MSKEKKNKEKKNLDRKQQKTKKIMAFVVAPILFTISALMVLGIIDLSPEKPTYVGIVSELDVHCYNVNWFGQHGFQIVYQESLIEIAEKLGENDLDFTASQFYEDQQVVDYLVMECPHLDSKLEAPADYDPSLGTDALYKCLIRKAETGMPDFEEFCAKYIELN